MNYVCTVTARLTGYCNQRNMQEQRLQQRRMTARTKIRKTKSQQRKDDRRHLCGTMMLTFSLLLTIVTILIRIPVTAAQEYPNPLFETNQFNTTAKFRQNVCERQRLYDSGEIKSLDLALEGLEIRVNMRLNAYFELDEEGKINEDYPGLTAVLLDEVAKRGKFTWRDSYSILGRPIGGKSWTDMLVWSANTYDVVASWWDNTLDRVSKGIVYPESWYDASYILVGKKDSDETDEEEVFNPWSWLAPFDSAVWGLTLLTIVASGLIYMFLDAIDPYSDKREIRSHPVQSIYLSALGFAGHMDFEPQTHPARLFTISLAMWALLMGAAYTANLASFLVVKNADTTVQVESLKDAVKTTRPICIWDGTQSELLVRKNYPNAELIEKKEEVDTLRGVLNGECEVAVASLTSLRVWERDASINSDCELAWVGRKVKDVPAGFAMKQDSGTQCTSLIRDVFHVHMLRMKEDGFIEQAWDEYLTRTATANCDAFTSDTSSSTTTTSSSNGINRRLLRSSSDATEAERLLRTGGRFSAASATGAGQTSLDAQELNIKNMGGIFLMHGGLSLVAIIFALVHRWIGLTARRDKERKEKNLRRHMKRTEFSRNLNCVEDDAERMEVLQEYLMNVSDKLTNGSDTDVKLRDIDESIRETALESKMEKISTRQDEQMVAMENLTKQLASLTNVLGGVGGSGGQYIKKSSYHNHTGTVIPSCIDGFSVNSVQTGTLASTPDIDEEGSIESTNYTID